MNRIYLPYPIELILKIISWFTVIVIDTIELVLTPFMHIGPKCSAVFAALAAIFSTYAYLSVGITISQALSLFGTLLVLFAVFLIVVHLINYLFVKVFRPPFANVIFAPVALSFRCPFVPQRVRA